MPTNTTTLIIVTALAALVLVGASAIVVYKTRYKGRKTEGTTLRDLIDADMRRLRRQEDLADRLDAAAHAAQTEIDIKKERASSLRHQATAHRDEAVTFRDHLNELRDQADKLSVAAEHPNIPRRNQ